MTKEERMRHNNEVLFDCNLRELTKDEEKQVFYKALLETIINNKHNEHDCKPQREDNHRNEL